MRTRGNEDTWHEEGGEEWGGKVIRQRVVTRSRVVRGWWCEAHLLLDLGLIKIKDEDVKHF